MAFNRSRFLKVSRRRSAVHEADDIGRNRRLLATVIQQTISAPRQLQPAAAPRPSIARENTGPCRHLGEKKKKKKKEKGKRRTGEDDLMASFPNRFLSCITPSPSQRLHHNYIYPYIPFLTFFPMSSAAVSSASGYEILVSPKPKRRRLLRFSTAFLPLPFSFPRHLR